MSILTTITTTVVTATVPADVDLPDIQPDYSFPVFGLLNKVFSWILAGGLTLTGIALIFAILVIIFKGFGSRQVQDTATSRIIWVLLGTVALGGFTGFWAWAVGLDLGF